MRGARLPCDVRRNGRKRGNASTTLLPTAVIHVFTWEKETVPPPPSSDLFAPGPSPVCPRQLLPCRTRCVPVQTCETTTSCPRPFPAPPVCAPRSSGNSGRTRATERAGLPRLAQGSRRRLQRPARRQRRPAAQVCAMGSL
ncbi:hypothetical protein AV530_013770 [Patagioenas fasciata monilis]|uniref:Uncharacterized protein n=1 Tax=Patagioenas fasciata monilis TaxID=372326 RepID=A0A1V4J826_PATFA|nr:hypothetical protein AV530_013770 [Patagioenas fasciata monilis]